MRTRFDSDAYGQRAQVAQQYRTGMTIAMHADPDGVANDVRFVPELLPEIRKRLSTDTRLWIADAQFCDLIQIGYFRETDDHFLLRYNGKVPFFRMKRVPRSRGMPTGGPTKKSGAGSEASSEPIAPTYAGSV